MKHGIDRQNSSTGATYARDEQTKNRQRQKHDWQTGYPLRPPTWSYRNQILHAW